MLLIKVIYCKTLYVWPVSVTFIWSTNMWFNAFSILIAGNSKTHPGYKIQSQLCCKMITKVTRTGLRLLPSQQYLLYFTVFPVWTLSNQTHWFLIDLFQMQSAWQTWLSSSSTSCTNTPNLLHTVTPHTQVRPHTHTDKLRQRVSVFCADWESGLKEHSDPPCEAQQHSSYLLSLNLVPSHAALWLSPGRPCFIAPFILVNFTAVINSVPYLDFVRGGSSAESCWGSHRSVLIFYLQSDGYHLRHLREFIRKSNLMQCNVSGKPTV